MRAWLLILAVLATLQITTQVASTEGQQQVLQNRKSNKNQNQESSSLSPLSSSSSSYSLPVIVDTSTSKLSDSLSDHSINNDKTKTPQNTAAAESDAAPEEEDEDSLSHHQEKLTLKPDTDTLVKVQNTLLSAFGLQRRPKKLDRSKMVIPEAMKKLYAKIMSQGLDSINIPKPGLHTKTANTVRSFTHQGEWPFLFFL